MKNPNLIILSILAGTLSLNLSAQKVCTVLKAEIANNYEGKCKNGLAHGKGIATGVDTYEGQFSKGLPEGHGTYSWANGDTYVGDWEQGLRHGEGTMTFKSAGNDSTLTGIWENDKYSGPLPPKPVVLSSMYVDRYKFTKMGKSQNRVLIDFYRSGIRNTEIENLMPTCSSGNMTRLGESFGFENIIYPVTIKLSYYTWNQAHTQMINPVFEFTIADPGDWVVSIHN